MKISIGVAGIYVCMFSFYSYTFFWGGYLRYNDIKNGDEEYTGGRILGIMFCLLTGSFGLMGLGPNLKNITEAKVAGYLTFNFIDSKVAISSNDESKPLI